MDSTKKCGIIPHLFHTFPHTKNKDKKNYTADYQ